MRRNLAKLIICSIALVSACESRCVLAANEMPVARALALTLPTAYEFSEEKLAGFYRKKLSPELRILGWEIADSLDLGQANVGDKWGFGMVLQKGNTAYGINHRGIQIMKRF